VFGLIGRIINIEQQQKVFHHHSVELYQTDILQSDGIFSFPFIDLIVTSPPYNVGINYSSNNDELSYADYVHFSRQWMEKCFVLSRPQARFCLNIPLDKNKGGHQSVGADLTNIAKNIGWQYKTTIIWNEGNISKRTAWGSWKSASAPCVIAPVELIVVFYKDQWKKTSGTKESDIAKDEFMAYTNGLWTFNGESKKRIGHPAPFPKELPYRCIKLFSYIGDIVFDPFAGSGTTLIVAEKLKRKGVGTEIDVDYFNLAKKRIKKELGSLLSVL